MNNQMRMVFLSFILIMAFSSCYFPMELTTEEKTETVYYNYKTKIDSGSIFLTSDYYTSTERTHDYRYVKKQFYPTTSRILEYTSYEDAQLTSREGPCKRWLDNGTLFEEGEYRNDKMEGRWNIYDLDAGFLRMYGNYKEGQKEGPWTLLNSKGIKIATFNYVKGVKQGQFEVFDAQKLVVSGDFKDGQLDDQSGHKKDSIFYYLRIVSELPCFKDCESSEDIEKCNQREFSKLFSKKLNYPRFAREKGVQGRAIVSFYVNQNGEVGNVQIYRGLCTPIKYECQRLLNSLPAFHPATISGYPINVKLVFSIDFRLIY